MLRELMAKDHSHTAELARIISFELVDLPTGYWLQFSRPAELAAAILSAVERCTVLSFQMGAPALVACAVSIRGRGMGRGFGIVRTGFDGGVDGGDFCKGS